MSCDRCEELLFAGLDRDLEPEQERLLRRHLRACASCRRLMAVLEGREPDDVPAVPDDLVAAVMQRTSGAACDRVLEQLAAARVFEQPVADRAGGARDAEEAGASTVRQSAGLLAEHLDACDSCAAVAAVLRRLQVELPALAELDPGADFVAGVLRVTVGAPAPAPASKPAPVPPRRAARGPLIASTERFAAAWVRLARRPRLAFEGAYVGALLLLLVFGLPSPSVAELPARAFGGVRMEVARVERAVDAGFDAALAFGQRRWQDVSTSAAAYLAASENDADRRAMQQRLRGWAGATQNLFAGIWNSIFAPVFEQLRGLWSEPRGNDSSREPGPSGDTEQT